MQSEGFTESVAKEVSPHGIRATIVEPGGFRSDLAGGSLARAKTIIDDYDATSGATREYWKARHGTQPGDTSLLAAALCKVVEMEDPPLRLALGADAWQQVEDKANFVAKELARWKDISLSTSYGP